MKVLPRRCTYPGCGHRVTSRRARRCDTHQVTSSGSRDPVYASPRWADIRARVLRERPWCECDASCCPRLPVWNGSSTCGRRSDMVDHISPRVVEVEASRDPERRENLQALAGSPCHGRKTVRQDGGFGRPRKERPHVS